MEEILEESSNAKSLGERKSELERKKFEENRNLVNKANQLRACCYAHNPEFFQVGKEECELLEKFFPAEAKKLKEKLDREQKKDERHPGSVNYSDLLMEIEGLANKAFKTMLENMKSQQKSAEQKEKETPFKSDAEIEKMQREYDNERQSYETAKRESMEAEKNRPAQKKSEGGAKGELLQDLEDSYYEGYTGKTINRPKQKTEEVPMSKKEQKKLEKQQKKMEKAQKKLEKAKKGNKVSAVSLDELNQAKGEMNSGNSNQANIEAEKLKAYENKLKERASAKAANKESSESSQEQGMGMIREYNPPTPSSSSGSKPKR